MIKLLIVSIIHYCVNNITCILLINSIFHSEVKVLSCLFSNTCIGMAIDVISILELRGEGFQFSDFYTPLSADDKFNMYAIVGMLLFDSMLYFIIAW